MVNELTGHSGQEAACSQTVNACMQMLVRETEVHLVDKVTVLGNVLSEAILLTRFGLVTSPQQRVVVQRPLNTCTSHVTIIS